MKTITMTIKLDQTKIRNLGHFEAQLNNRVHIFVPKKGKGSFKRNKRVEY